MLNDPRYRYCYAFDSSFEVATSMWTEPKCKDPQCEYCAKRPADHSHCSDDRCRREKEDYEQNCQNRD